MRVRRRFASVALLAALNGSFGSVFSVSRTAAADNAPKPSGVVARQGGDLISRGQTLFDDQQYEESIQTLSGALVRPSNTKAQKVEIYRLLALNYITLNHKDEAEASVRGLLSLEPSYELPVRESPRFRDFFAAVRQRWESEGRPGLVKETEPPPAPVTMKHVSPSEATDSTQIDLTATLEDTQARVKEIKLYYRTGSKGAFDETLADIQGSRVAASIPPSAVKGPIVEYYWQGTNAAGLPIVSRGDSTAPFRIPVPEKRKGWVLPVAITGSVLGAAGVAVIVMAAAGVFKTNTTIVKEGGGGGGGGGTPPANATGTVNVSVSSHGMGVRW